MSAEPRPRIVVAHAAVSHEPPDSVPALKVRWYREAVERAGGEVLAIAPDHPRSAIAAALAAMDGLMICGGADLDPALYGEPPAGARGLEPERDSLEREAWAAAEARALPILGLCRGLQALNVFGGGSLLQHVDGHDGPAPTEGPACTHPLTLVPGTRIAGILAEGAGATFTVNSYHHQAVTADRLAPGFLPSGWSPSPEGDLVEAMERPGERFVVAVQCHPERTESTPAAFERLFRAFIDAARAGGTRGA